MYPTLQQTDLSGHDVCVKNREEQSQDCSIEETKVGLEGDGRGGRGGRCQEEHLGTIHNSISQFFLQ